MNNRPSNEKPQVESSASPEASKGKLIYFRRRRYETSPFLVHVINSKEEYCSNFNGLNEALDFIDKIEEADAGTDCHLFQLIPMEDSDSL